MSSRTVRLLIAVCLLIVIRLGYDSIKPAAHRCPVPYSSEIAFKDREALRPNLSNNSFANSDQKEDVLKIAFAGDLMQHREQMHDNFADNLRELSPILKTFDMAMANLEFPVLSSAPVGPELCSARFNGSIDHLKAIAEVGFTVLSTTNNHSFDMGLIGVQSTLDAVRKEGVIPVGTADDVSKSPEAALVNVKGVNLGILAYTFLLNDYLDKNGEIEVKPENLPISILNVNEWRGVVRKGGIQKISNDVQRIRQKGAQFVVGYIHWGDEWHFSQSPEQEIVAHDMIDSGFDMVIGSHPHVLEPLEIYKGKLIAYSLGTLTSAFNETETRTAVILGVDLKISRNGIILSGIKAYPTLSDRFTHQVRFLKNPSSIEEHKAFGITSDVFGDLQVLR